MTQKLSWRENIWNQMDRDWDVVIVGGGITGAGLFRMAAESGLKTLLVDACDFSFGTSSRSSKLVHGGIRYLRNLQFRVTYEGVRERERILKEAPNLVIPLEFIFPIYKKYHYTPTQVGIALGLYDLFGKKNVHGQLTAAELDQMATSLNRNDLSFAYYYYDGLVDDSRLVFRNIQEGIDHGGTALNYTKATDLLRNQNGLVSGILIKDETSEGQGKYLEVFAKVIVNATGPWSDDLRSKLTNKKIIRKLRGSHIQFSQERFPIKCAFSLVHPIDKRALFALPWEGVVVVGSTDLDHPAEYEIANTEPFMTIEEEEYLLVAANQFFPSLKLESKDVISSFSGLRPIVSSSDDTKPSKASRAHIVLEENGLITITGGKLTIYRQMAYDVMRKIHNRVGLFNNHQKAILDKNIPFEATNYPDSEMSRWGGRFGSHLSEFLASIQKEESSLIPGTHTSWAEIRWAARNEKVIHLDDLLLRRVRLGLLLPGGGMQHSEKIRWIMQEEAGWDNKKWTEELKRYQEIINRYYSNGKSSM
jgi:glycerol-3-phosphate dehydrogenase